MSENKKFILITIVSTWILSNLMIIAVGSGMDSKKGVCNTNFNRRIEYLFPAHVFGCWLFEDFNKTGE